jgi:propane monooxygenase coupling protein
MSGDDAESTVRWGESNDYVGLVMQRTEEGEALARLLSERDGVELIDNSSFVEIRAKGRLVVDFAEIGDELGFEVDGYWLQGQIATHIGGLVLRDESFLLTADPRELVSGMDNLEGDQVGAGA